MIIKNSLVFNNNFKKQNLYLKDGMLVNKEDYVDNDNKVIDADGLYAIPGLIDLHTHGVSGSDFCTGDLHHIAREQKKHGITSFLATSMTLSEEMLTEIFAKVRNHKPFDDEAHVIGINMEGPYITRPGAQNTKYIKGPNIDMFKRLQMASGNNIKIVTLAPEMEGSLEFVKALAKSVIISLGHSNATYDEAKKAFDLGASHVTHLFNAMPFNHRDVGIAGAGMEAGAYLELICDFYHVNKLLVKHVIKNFPDRVVLISDSMEGTCCEDGIYELGGQKVIKKGHEARLESGALAGSVSTLFDCFTNIARLIDLETACKLNLNAARELSLQKELKIGNKVDIILLNKNFELVEVL